MRKMWKTFPNVDNVDNLQKSNVDNVDNSKKGIICNQQMWIMWITSFHIIHTLKPLILKDFLNFKKSYPHFSHSFPQKKVELSTFFLKYYVNQKMWITLWITFLKSGKIEKLSTKCG